MITTIGSDIVLECRDLWTDLTGGNKVAAIQHLRKTTGLGLKESKMIIEADFAADECNKYNVAVGLTPEETPGYHIDKVFELGRELAYHYAELEKLGFTFGSK